MLLLSYHLKVERKLNQHFYNCFAKNKNNFNQINFTQYFVISQYTL